MWQCVSQYAMSLWWVKSRKVKKEIDGNQLSFLYPPYFFTDTGLAFQKKKGDYRLNIRRCCFSHLMLSSSMALPHRRIMSKHFRLKRSCYTFAIKVFNFYLPSCMSITVTAWTGDTGPHCNSNHMMLFILPIIREPTISRKLVRKANIC